MIEVLKQALEALEQVTKELLAVRDELAERGARPTTNVFHQRLWDSSFSAYTDHAIPAAQSLRKAIAELESQYPHGMYGAEDLDKAWKSGYDNCKDQYAYLDKQEPVAWMREDATLRFADGKMFAVGQPFYTHPPQRKPLTDEQIKKASLEAGMQEHYMDFHSGFIRFAKVIEAAHGIKE